MRKIKSYEDFTNEEINWRKGLTGAAMAASLNLTSCDEPIKQKSKDFDNKIPKIETLVQNHINSESYKSDFIELIDIRGPYGEKEFNNVDSLKIPNPFRKYYIISKIKNQNGEEVYLLLLYIDIQNCEKKNEIFIDIPIKMNSSGLPNHSLNLSYRDFEFKTVDQINKSIIEAERNQKILIKDGFVKLHFSSLGFVNRDCELNQFGELHITDRN